MSVFILDYEPVSPIGVGNEAVLSSLKNKFLAGDKISGFSTEGLPIEFGAEIKDDLTPFYNKEPEQIIEAATYDRKFELALTAANRFSPRLLNYLEKCPPARAGIILGIGLDIPLFDKFGHQFNDYDPAKEKSFLHAVSTFNDKKRKINRLFNSLDISSIYLAEKFGLGAFQQTVLTACTSSAQALAFSFDAIKRGQVDFVLTGGSDSLLNLVGLIAFTKLGVIQPSDSLPAKVCKPLDKNRGGTILGEGAGLMLLASEEGVKQSGLEPKLELKGYGNTLDGYKITAPRPDGEGMQRAMQQALVHGGIEPSEVDYINLHGTGTFANDPIELDAVKQVMQESAKDVWVSSTKDRHGHLISAAGIIEMIILNLSMENGFMPCTVNTEKPIVDDIPRLVLGDNQAADLKTCLCNSFAFGGVNTSLAVQKVGV